MNRATSGKPIRNESRLAYCQLALLAVMVFGPAR
jgi:hypothetical protein